MTEPRQILQGWHDDAHPLSRKGKGPPKMRHPPPRQEKLSPKHCPTGPNEGNLGIGNASEGSSSSSSPLHYGGQKGDLSEVLPAKVQLSEDQISTGEHLPVLAPYPRGDAFAPTPVWDSAGDVQFRSREERQLIEQREWELLHQRQKDQERGFLLQCQRERVELNLKQRQERHDDFENPWRQQALPPPRRSHRLLSDELPSNLLPACLAPELTTSGMLPGGNRTYQGLGAGFPYDGPPSFQATDEDMLRQVPIQHPLSVQQRQREQVGDSSQLQQRLLQLQPQRVPLESQENLAQRGVGLTSHASPQSFEKRSTVMLRNLPVGFSRDMLTDLFDRHGFSRCYDFVYMPINFRTQVTFGYAFVNLTSEQYAKRIKEVFEGFADWGLRSDRVCEVTWSDMHQGLPMHIERYRNSPVMHESVPDEYKPAFYVDGIRVMFPPPTKRIRAPRIRHTAGGGSAGNQKVFHGVESL